MSKRQNMFIRSKTSLILTLVSAKKSALLTYVVCLPKPKLHLTSQLTQSQQDKALLRKLDFRLIPWLSFLYLISFLDRTNIGNAKVDGLQEDLNMTNGQYNASLTIFFVSYSVFEPLTNVLLKKLRPSIFLPLIMIWWGICMTCMGLVHNYAGLMTAVSNSTVGGVRVRLGWLTTCL
jgi:sugar phosphate permease